MTNQQDINLQWNDHVTYLTKMLSFQRTEDSFVDICLVSEDGYIFKAHQVVLSMTSGYFKRILGTIRPTEYPTVVLDGINHRELSYLMNYMYEGVAKVNQNCIDAILKAADDLEIKGLSKIRSNTSIRQLLTKDSPTSTEDLDTLINSHGKLLFPGVLHKDRAGPEFVEKTVVNISLQNCPIKGFAKSSDTCDSYLDQTRGMDLSLSRGQTIDSVDKASIITEPYDGLRLNKAPELYTENASLIKTGCDLNSDPVSKQTHMGGDNCTATYCSDNSDENSLQIHHTDYSPAPSDDSVADATFKKHSPVEVCCSDGAVTISVAPRPIATAGTPSTMKREQLGREETAGARKRRKTKKEMEEEKRKWLEKERKNLFSNTVMKYCKAKSLQKGRSLYVTDSESEYGKSESKTKLLYTNQSVSRSSSTASPKYSKENALTANCNLTRDCKPKSTQDKGLAKTVYQFPSINPLKLFTLPKMKSKAKQTRTSLTVGEKIKVIEAFLDGKSQRQIAHLCGIGKTQVCGIIKSREKILRLYHESILRGEKATLKRKRVSEYASLNEHLLQWHRHMTLVMGVKISTGMLRAKALEIAGELSYKDFKASNGWLATFKAKNNLKLARTKVAASSSCFSPDSEDDDGGGCDNDHQQDDFYDEEESPETDSETPQMANNPAAANNLVDVPLHLGPAVRSDIHHDPTQSLVSSAGLAVQNTSSIIPSSGVVGKNSQMNNMSLCSNIAAAYNLTRDHVRPEIVPARTDINIGEIHPPVGSINSALPLSHSTIQKADGSLSYKSEESVSYGYDHQGRMNENNARGTEYNYSHYGFPGAYYGYHFLGQY